MNTVTEQATEGHVVTKQTATVKGPLSLLYAYEEDFVRVQIWSARPQIMLSPPRGYDVCWASEFTHHLQSP